MGRRLWLMLKKMNPKASNVSKFLELALHGNKIYFFAKTYVATLI